MNDYKQQIIRMITKTDDETILCKVYTVLHTLLELKGGACHE